MNHKHLNRRSIIFYSALEPQNWEDAIGSGADMICLDMDDSTSANRKEKARNICFPLFERFVEWPVIRLVRINSPHTEDGI